MTNEIDIGPVMELARLRIKNKKNYEKLMSEIKIVTIDLINLSTIIVEEQLKKQKQKDSKRV